MGRWATVAGLAAIAVAVAALAAPLREARAQDQVTAPPGDVPGLPTGDGVVRGRVVHPDDPSAVADLPIALYALRPDGQPGLGGTRSDATGSFVFEGISTDPGTVYLLGTQYRDVPFGQRVTFGAGQTALDVELPLRRLTTDASALLVPATVFKLDWMGSQLFVQVSHQLRNPTGAVVFVPADARAGARPPFASALPPDVLEFVDGQGGASGEIEREGEALSFWGPLYPGDQEVRYGFVIAGPEVAATGAEREAEPFTLALTLPAGAGEVQLLTPARDPAPRAEGLVVTDEATDIDGVPYARATLGGVAPGGAVEIGLELPASSADTSALSIARADYWIDHDDTAMRITAEVQLDVGAPVRLLGSPDDPLLHFALPDGAEFMGLSGASAALGVRAGAEGGLDVLGPLPPGESALGFRYRIPVEAGRAALDLSFDQPVALLNVLVADTGIIVEAPRLHKRRPFRQGTRVYLHREAFQVSAGEPVAIELQPFERSEVPRVTTTLVALALAAGIVLFLVTPLRRQGERDEAADPTAELGIEREAIYEALRDLEHDRDTGKLDEADYARMRGELRASAVELMRREQQASRPPTEETAPAQGVECPSCAGAVEPGWKFCSHCGAPIQVTDKSA